ncbi:MAG: hypothetical protein QNL45_03350, partial [Nitrospirota bacterium]|nr:hypothetical protein [Nitrospirota bacterium]
MTPKHSRQGIRLFPIWAGVLSLILGFPLLSLASGYGHDGGSAHHTTGKTSPHESGSMGHGKGYSGGSTHGGHGKGYSEGGTHGVYGMKGKMGRGSHG